MHGCLRVGFSGTQDGVWELGLVGGIREMIGFDAETIMLFINDTALALNGAVEEVAGIELNSRFGGVNFHDTPGLGFAHTKG